MPYIEEQALLDLHQSIENEQRENSKLVTRLADRQNQLREEEEDFKKYKKKAKIIYIILALLALLAFIAYMYKGTDTQQKYDVAVKENQSLQDNVTLLKQKVDSLQMYTTADTPHTKIVSFDAAKDLKDSVNDVEIYSVQIGAFKNNDLSLVSTDLITTNVAQHKSYYTYSIGAFNSLEEAQNFRRELVRIGFRDAFIASYLNGERVRLHDPN